MSLAQRYFSQATTARQTRDCVDPWFFAYLAATHEVHPCCWHKSVGTLEHGLSLGDVLNGEKMRELREQLLSGNMDDDCSCCPSRPLATTADLRARLEMELAQSIVEVYPLGSRHEAMIFMGAVESIEAYEKNVEVRGWGMLRAHSSLVLVETDLPVCSAAVMRVTRPDVATALQDPRLANSGFVLSLQLSAPPPENWTLAVRTEDKDLGRHILHPVTTPEGERRAASSALDEPEAQLAQVRTSWIVKLRRKTRPLRDAISGNRRNR